MTKDEQQRFEQELGRKLTGTEQRMVSAMLAIKRHTFEQLVGIVKAQSGDDDGKAPEVVITTHLYEAAGKDSVQKFKPPEGIATTQTVKMWDEPKPESQIESNINSEPQADSEIDLESNPDSDSD